MPDTDVIRKNLAEQLQECGDTCRMTWELMLDSADPGSLGSGRFTPQELKTLSQNAVQAQESLAICQGLLIRRVSPVSSLRAALDTIINTDENQMIETDPQNQAEHQRVIEQGIATLQNVRAAQQKQKQG